MSRLIIPDFTLHPASSVDLHMHTTYSDGSWPATQLIEYLASNGFDLVAVTDHDRVNKVAEIQELGAAHGLAVLSGVEMSTEWRGPVGQNRMADLLCFGFDPLQSELAPLAEQIDRQRIANAYEINEYLRHKGYDFPRQDELLADHNGKLDRPGDNIRLLLEHGYISDYREGFKLIVEAGYHSIRYDIAEVVEATHRSGGVSLIAHPGRNEPEFTFYDIPLLDQIRAEVPLDGIEVIHPTHSKEMTERYLAYVQQHALLSTTGSDSHSRPTRMPIKHRAEISQRFFERLGIRIV